MINEKNLLLSIIIPVYNVSQYLHKCLDSILNALKEFETDYEIILVNDGSQDDSGAICDEYAKNHKHVLTFHKENGGQSDARNVGIQKASGCYITFIDSDDWVTEDIKKIIPLIKNNLETTLFQLGYKYTDKNDIEGLCFQKKEFGPVNTDKKTFYKNITTDTSPCTKIIRRSFITENNLYFVKGIIMEDFEWCIRVWLLVKNYYNTGLNYYRYLQNRSGSTMTEYSMKNFNDAAFGIITSSKKIKEAELKPVEKKYLLNYILGRYYSSIYLITKNSNKANLKPVINTVKQNKSLLKYPKGHKLQAKLFWLSTKIIGTTASVKLLSALLEITKRKNK